jgi:hypothetical protein
VSVLVFVKLGVKVGVPVWVTDGVEVKVGVTVYVCVIVGVMVYVGVTVLVSVTVFVGVLVGDGVGALYISILLLVPFIEDTSASVPVTVKGDADAVPKVTLKDFIPPSASVKV